MSDEITRRDRYRALSKEETRFGVQKSQSSMRYQVCRSLEVKREREEAPDVGRARSRSTRIGV